MLEPTLELQFNQKILYEVQTRTKEGLFINDTTNTMQNYYYWQVHQHYHFIPFFHLSLEKWVSPLSTEKLIPPSMQISGIMSDFE